MKRGSRSKGKLKVYERRISINTRAMSLLGKPRHVKIFFDKKRQTIMIEPSKTPDLDTRLVTYFMDRSGMKKRPKSEKRRTEQSLSEIEEYGRGALIVFLTEDIAEGVYRQEDADPKIFVRAIGMMYLPKIK